jgi:hypothetical protein
VVVVKFEVLYMFGCFINLWEVEGFFKKSLGSMGGLYRSLRFFLENYGLQFFSKSLEAHT